MSDKSGVCSIILIFVIWIVPTQSGMCIFSFLRIRQFFLQNSFVETCRLRQKYLRHPTFTSIFVCVNFRLRQSSIASSNICVNFRLRQQTFVSIFDCVNFRLRQQTFVSIFDCVIVCQGSNVTTYFLLP
jgi:hypothetical protein